MSDHEGLRKRIQELEEELSKKDKDISIYKKELSEASGKLETLIGQVSDQLQQSLKIQKFLVPTEFPNIQGFEFSTKFSSSMFSGGDYFDIFEHYDKMRFGLFLSSASGYGMSALFLSVLMELTYQIEDSKHNGPNRVLKGMTQEMLKQSQGEDEAAIFYGVFDRRKFQMTYCNMGQPLAIHYEHDSQSIKLLEPCYPPYSSSQKAKPQELENRVIDLKPLDKLVFCSTGFLSLKNDQGEFWGMDEILSIVKKNVEKTVHELRNELFFQAANFSQEQPKDLTVIVTEVKSRIMKLA